MKGQVAEAVVELNRTKMPCIKRKHLAGGRFFQDRKERANISNASPKFQ
jgi:hypothetical protein